MTASPRIQGYKAHAIEYDSPLSLYLLASQEHKMDNSSALYLDELLYNSQFYCKQAYSVCKFIYVLRGPESVIDYMMHKDGLRAEVAARSYAFRLRRLCEMAKRTPGALLLTYDDLIGKRGLDLVAAHLGIKDSIRLNPDLLDEIGPRLNPVPLDQEIRSSLQDSYERYLYFLRNQSLLMPD